MLTVTKKLADISIYKALKHTIMPYRSRPYSTSPYLKLIPLLTINKQ